MRPAWRKSEKFILVMPLEGLANRLRVVVNALQLAEDMCRSLMLCWQPASTCQVAWAVNLLHVFQLAMSKRP